MPGNPTAFDDGAGGDTPMSVRMNVLANISKFIAGTNRVLERLTPARVPGSVPIFQPYFEAIRRIALERDLETSGVEALKIFADTWDSYCRKVESGHKADFFSPSDIEAMSESILGFKAWLHRHFPDECEYGYGSTK
jgi:hypothetical protein